MRDTIEHMSCLVPSGSVGLELMALKTSSFVLSLLLSSAGENALGGATSFDCRKTGEMCSRREQRRKMAGEFVAPTICGTALEPLSTQI